MPYGYRPVIGTEGVLADFRTYVDKIKEKKDAENLAILEWDQSRMVNQEIKELKQRRKKLCL